MSDRSFKVRRNTRRHGLWRLSRLLLVVSFLAFHMLGVAAESDVETFAELLATSVGSKVEACEITKPFLADLMERDLTYRYNRGKEAPHRESLCIRYDGPFSAFKQLFKEFTARHRDELGLRTTSGWRYREPKVEVTQGGTPVAVDKVVWRRRQLAVNGTQAELVFENTAVVRIWYDED